MAKWQPGVSGNPKGRPPRGLSLAEHLQAELIRVVGDDGRTTAAQAVVTTLVRLARDGDIQAIRTVLERIDGKVPDSLHHSGDNGGPLVFTLALGEHHDDE